MLETVANQFDINSVLLIAVLIISVLAPLISQYLQNKNANKIQMRKEIEETVVKAFREYLDTIGCMLGSCDNYYPKFFACHLQAYVYASQHTRLLMDDLLERFQKIDCTNTDLRDCDADLIERLSMLSKNLCQEIEKAKKPYI